MLTDVVLHGDAEPTVRSVRIQLRVLGIVLRPSLHLLLRHLRLLALSLTGGRRLRAAVASCSAVAVGRVGSLLAVSAVLAVASVRAAASILTSTAVRVGAVTIAMSTIATPLVASVALLATLAAVLLEFFVVLLDVDEKV